MYKEILLVAINAKYIHSNLAVYSLKAAAENYSDHISIAEYTINNRVEEILDDIYVKKPGMIGFSCYIWNINMVKDIAQCIKKVLPKCRIICGGPEVSFDSEEFLNENGELWAVIRKNQGADSAKKKMMEVYGNCEIVKRDRGFYILKSCR